MHQPTLQRFAESSAVKTKSLLLRPTFAEKHPDLLRFELVVYFPYGGERYHYLYIVGDLAGNMARRESAKQKTEKDRAVVRGAQQAIIDSRQSSKWSDAEKAIYEAVSSALAENKGVTPAQYEAIAQPPSTVTQDDDFGDLLTLWLCLASTARPSLLKLMPIAPPTLAKLFSHLSGDEMKKTLEEFDATFHLHLINSVHSSFGDNGSIAVFLALPQSSRLVLFQRDMKNSSLARLILSQMQNTAEALQLFNVLPTNTKDEVFQLMLTQRSNVTIEEVE
jgi:hypothetical protein